MEHGIHLEYSVSIARNPSACRISLDISNVSQQELILVTPIQGNLMNVDEFRVVDRHGNPLRFEHSVRGESGRNVAGEFEFSQWKIQLAGAKQATVSYRAKLGYNDRGEYYGYIGEQFGLVSGFYLFIAPEENNRIGRIKVSFNVPKAWRVLLPKNLSTDSENSTVELGRSLQTMLRAQIAWGRFKETTKHLLNTSLHIFTYAEWPAKYREFLLDNVISIAEQQIEVTGGMPNEAYTIIFTPKTESDSSSIFVPASFDGQAQCMDPSTDTDWIHFAEELFKRYSMYNAKMRMKFEDPRDGWYADGIAGFYGIQALNVVRSQVRTAKERLRLLYFQYAFSTLPPPNTHSGRVAIPFDRYPLGTRRKLSPQAKTQIQRINAPVMAYLLDRQIRLHTGNTKNLDDLVRIQYDFRKNGFAKPIILLRDLRKLTGHDFGDFFKKRIHEPNFVDEPLYLPSIKYPLPKIREGAASFLDTLGKHSKLTLIIAGGNESYLENCGCALNQSGGVARRATVINQIRDKSAQVLILDVGDAFPKIAQYDPLTNLEAETYLQAMNTIGFHSLSVSSNEIYAAPRPSILSPSLTFPVLSSNIVRKKDRKLVLKQA